MSRSSINPDIHYSRVPSSDLLSLACKGIPGFLKFEKCQQASRKQDSPSKITFSEKKIKFLKSTKRGKDYKDVQHLFNLKF